MKNTVLSIVSGLLLLFFGFCIGIVVGIPPREHPNIPSQREIQQRLEDLDNPRYDPNGVDGWIGTDSRTAWDNYTCDQHAKRAIEGE